MKGQNIEIPTDMLDMDLEQLLEAMDVHQVFEQDGHPAHLDGWWAVSNTYGIIAYFGDDTLACAYKLYYISLITALWVK